MPSNEDRIYKMRMYENKLADNVQAVNQQMRVAEFAEQHIKKREMREIEAREEAIRQCRERISITLAERLAWLEARSRALKQKKKQNAEACQKDQYVQQMLDKVEGSVRNYQTSGEGN